MDMKTVGKWSYLVGLGLAIVAALAGFSPPWLALVLATLGILTGLFEAETEKIVDYGVRYLTLVVVAGALTGRSAPRYVSAYRFAPYSVRYLTRSRLPISAAISAGVLPYRLARFTSAPASTKATTIPRLPP